MKNKIHLVLVLIIVPAVISLRPCNFCAIPTCEPNRHTLCRFTINDVAWERCVRLVRGTLEDSEVNRVVNLHNSLRERVFNGSEVRGRPGPQPPAANITYLEWDEELAEAAQVWAQQCPDDVDECRHVARFLVNQNVGTKRTRGFSIELSLEKIINGWFNEVVRFNATEVANYSEQNAEHRRTHHYTQMIWGNTRKIGCAQVKYHVANEYVLTLVCNYGPAGNNNGEAVYTMRNTGN